MNCASCGNTLAPDDRVCASCGTPVAGGGPESGDGPEGHWEQVAETGQVYEANLIAARLRDSDIEAQVVDQTFHAEPLPNVRDFSVVRVLVPADRLAEAREILSHSAALPADAEASGDENSIPEDNKE